MEGKLSNSSLISDQEEYDNTTESGPESPPSSLLNDMKMTSTSSPKRSKRGIQKRVVSVPIKDGEGSRLKGENATPPSDSWAWRKYGQKPIKGSPYPRGYYRCSSSKGCPARKQVERSKVDPTMLVVTYSCEHNHPWPLPSRNHHHHHQANYSPKSSDPKSETTTPQEPKNPEPEPEPELDLEEWFADLGPDEFGWFGGMETTPSTILESPIFSDTARSKADADVSRFFPMREEDESLFADLGELPECTAVFRPHRDVGPQVQIC